MSASKYGITKKNNYILVGGIKLIEELCMKSCAYC